MADDVELRFSRDEVERAGTVLLARVQRLRRERGEYWVLVSFGPSTSDDGSYVARLARKAHDLAEAG